MIFDVKPEHLKSLSPEESVDLVMEMIRTDARASGMNASCLNISSNVNEKDGGIDGDFVDAPRDSKHGMIKKGRTCYQIKSGKLSIGKVEVEDILIDKETKMLKKGVRSCLDRDDIFFVILVGRDLTSTKKTEVISMFHERLAVVDKKYTRSKIEVWSINQIRAFLGSFYLLRCHVRGEERPIKFASYDEWARMNDGSGMHEIFLREEHENLIEDMRSEMRKHEPGRYLRIIGEPGIGKTRLVRESVKPDDLKGAVAYFENPEELLDSRFLNYHLDPEDPAILVVDECGPADTSTLIRKINGANMSAMLVTIYNEPDEHKTFSELSSPHLKDQEIRQILESYVDNIKKMEQWVRLCVPSPRAAHMVGMNLKNNPDNILKSPNEMLVWDMCITGISRVNDDELKTRRTILTWISLFKKFGHAGQYKTEENLVSELVEKNEGIPKAVFTRTVKTLKNMKILQGNTTLYISPKILHVYLWTQWWEKFGDHLVDKVTAYITQHGSDNMLKWYREMFEYANESEAAGQTVSKLLEPGGFFDRNNALKTEMGASFFLILSKIDRRSALACAGRNTGDLRRESPLGLVESRLEIVRALEGMAMFADTFEESARILLGLAATESTSYSNNATGVFSKLFVPASGRYASTEVPPHERIPLLRNIMESGSESEKNVAAAACTEALRRTHMSVFVETGAFERQPSLWTAESDSEIISYYSDVLDLIAGFPANKKMAEAVLTSMRHLLSVPDLGMKVLDTAGVLYSAGGIDAEGLLKEITWIADSEKDRLPQDLLDEIKRLQDKVVGTGYSAMMHRYVAMDIGVDMGSMSGNMEPRKEYLVKLAEESLDPEKLGPELKWLVTEKAKYGHMFGYELASKNPGYGLLQTILDATSRAGERASGFFVGGYLMHVFDNDRQTWHDTLDVMYQDGHLCRILPEAVYRSGLTDRAASMITRGVREGRMDPGSLAMFQYGLVVRHLSEPVMLEWIDLLSGEDDPDCTGIAMSLFYSYFVYKKKTRLPKTATVKLLLHKNLLKTADSYLLSTMVRHYWKEIGLEFVERYPDDSVAILEGIVSNIDQGEFFVADGLNEQGLRDAIVKARPREAWKVVSKYVGPPLDKRAYLLRKWLCGWMGMYDGALSRMPLDDIFEWVDEDAESRAAYMAGFIPSDFVIVREFLARYDSKEAHRRIAHNFDTETWSGSGSVHYAEKKSKFEGFLEDEKDPRVRKWLEDYIRSIGSRAEIDRGFDERDM